MKTFLLSFLFALPIYGQVGATAESVTIPKPGGVMTLTNCTVTKLEPDGVKVTHAGGVAKVPWEHMPHAWKTGMYYDPRAAAEHREKVAVPVDPVITGEVLPLTVTPPATGLITKEQVKAVWLSAADPSKVSGLHTDGQRSTVSRVRDVAKAKSKFTGAAAVSDAEKLRQEIQKYRADILAGVHDLRAERVALENNVTVYEKAGDTANAQKCREQLLELPTR